MPVKETPNLGILYAFRDNNGTWECLGEVKEAEVSRELDPYRNMFAETTTHASTVISNEDMLEKIKQAVESTYEVKKKETPRPKSRPEMRRHELGEVWTIKEATGYPDDGVCIKKVIFNDPATIVLWSDGTKTVVKCRDGEIFDKHTGFAMCVVKKIYGPDFHHIINKFAGKCEDEKKVKYGKWITPEDLKETAEDIGDFLEMAQKQAEEELKHIVRRIIKETLEKPFEEPYNGRHLDE